MKLASVLGPDGRAILAAALDRHGDTWFVDLTAPDLPDMMALLAGGEPALARVRDALKAAGEAFEEARGKGRVLANETVQFLPPVPHPGKIIAVGANFRDHMAQAAAQLGKGAAFVKNLTSATEPVAFSKLPSTQTGHDTDLPYPWQTEQLAFEAELAVVIGRECRDVPVETALDNVAGYTIANDASLREIQMAEMGKGVLLLGKNADGTLPIGPWLVTRDEIADPQALAIRCRVNGLTRQDGSTTDMIHSVASLVSYYSKRLTLYPGDMFLTGSPAFTEVPPEQQFLKPGDEIEIEVEGIGLLRNRIGPRR